MNRKQIYAEIEQMFGGVPMMFKAVPDASLELEWKLFKRVQFDAGPVPNKYRELIGLAVSAFAKCHYCLFYHTEVAKMMGATQPEIEDAVHYAKSSAGWSTYLSGLQLNLEQFKTEVLAACDFVRARQENAEQDWPGNSPTIDKEQRGACSASQEYEAPRSKARNA